MTGADICFLATSKSGLGHLRRLSTIARAVKTRAPKRRLHLVSNAPPLGVSAQDLSVFASLPVCDRAEMAATAAQTGAGLLVLDTMVAPGVEALGLPLALVLREAPQAQLSRFALAGGRAWDLVVIANPAAHWMPPAGALRAERTAPVGWIYRSPGPRQERGERPHPPSVLVATGGGGTAQTAESLYAALDDLLARARRNGPPFTVVQAIGPRATGFGQLAQADRRIDPGPALNAVFRDADLVISTAGYNSVLELAVTDTPTLLVPIPRSIDDQAARAKDWGPRLGAAYDATAPGAAAEWLARQIAHPARRAPVDLGKSGEDAAAQAILQLG